jgi:hypothetical protein
MPDQNKMKAYAKNKMKGGNFKTCPGCPTPGKCKAAGKCMKGEKK